MPRRLACPDLAVAAAVLGEDGRTDRAYELTSPEPISPRRQAAVPNAEAVLHRPVGPISEWVTRNLTA
ncbi:hypothetical protein ACIHFE_24730 [Streptomyces sp. NPDC052396]|uniref:hypothetical protein n=1 Tax=Streptomyces sp. NPDC052396 TaxID=3365689 RepID=UPI0037CE26FB